MISSVLFLLARVGFLVFCVSLQLFVVAFVSNNFAIGCDLLQRMFDWITICDAFWCQLILLLLAGRCEAGMFIKPHSPADALQDLIFGKQGESRLSFSSVNEVLHAIFFIAMVYTCLPFVWLVSTIQNRLSSTSLR